MLGINIKEAIFSQLAGAKNEALGKITGYNWLSTQFRRYQANQKLKGPKTGSNTVDEVEFHNAVKHLQSEIEGTWNPFRLLMGIIHTIFGNNKTERIITTIQNLENYAHQHDAFRFVNDAQKCLLTQIEHRIYAVESLGSKYLGTSNNKVTNDPVLKALKSAIQAWLEPFDRIINGEVPEISRLSDRDIKFLANLRDRIRYSPKARYMEDLLPKYNEMIVQAQRASYSNSSGAQAQPRAQHRRTGQKLAHTAA